jgi:hypothetical protein
MRASTRRSGWSRWGRFTTGVVVVVTATVPALPGAAPRPSPFCSAVATFNASRPATRAESLAGLKQLAQAAPTRVKSALTAIVKAAKSGDVGSVLAQAGTAQPGQAGRLASAGAIVATAAVQSCQGTVNFLAAVPTGISERTVSPEVWTGTVCSALSGWGQSLNAAGASLVTPLSGVTTTVPEERTQFSQFVGTAIIRTQQLINQLNGAGTPKTKHGTTFAAAIHDGVAQAQQAFVQAQPAVQALPDDPQAFQVQTKALVQNLSDAGMHVVLGLHNAETEIKDPALSQAFFNESTCKGIA